ncbi:MAG: glycoside hydrolase family 25 protein [Rhizomicrobium sp.]
MPNFKVVDLSHYSPTPDFAAAKAGGVLGIVHKATQGSGYVDAKYAARAVQAKKAGLLWGAYHFGTSADVDAQVAKFLSVVKPDASTLVALDFEQNEASPAQTMSLPQAKQFLKAIEAKLGRKAVLYGGSYLKSKLGTTVDPYLAQHRLWWAQYGNAALIPPTWKSYWLWQYTDGHNGPTPHAAPGLGSPDIDTFDGTDAELATQWAS